MLWKRDVRAFLFACKQQVMAEGKREKVELLQKIDRLSSLYDAHVTKWQLQVAGIAWQRKSRNSAAHRSSVENGSERPCCQDTICASLERLGCAFCTCSVLAAWSLEWIALRSLIVESPIHRLILTPKSASGVRPKPLHKSRISLIPPLPPFKSEDFVERVGTQIPLRGTCFLRAPKKYVDDVRPSFFEVSHRFL